ncbi:hypothetical protein SMICM304S_06644 [Streptomyces microflavus]
MDRLVHPFFQAEFMDDLGDPGLPFRLRGVLREAESAAYPRALRTVSWECRMSSCGTRPMRWRSSAKSR